MEEKISDSRQLGGQLYNAACNGKEELVLKLLEKGTNPNWSDSYGWTPLHAACYNDKASIVQLLFEKSANINQCTIYDDTSLHIACWRGNLDCVKQLVSTGCCDLNAVNTRGRTPLGEAYNSDHADIITFLASKQNVDVNGKITEETSAVSDKRRTSQEDGTVGQDLNIEDLKRRAGITNTQLDKEIIDHDLYNLAGCFDNVESYLDKLGLSAGQQTDIKDLASHRGTQSAMNEALKIWRQRNPFTATLRALFIILLSLRKGQVAVLVCKYITDTVPEL